MNLDNGKVNQLANLAYAPGYQVLLDIMEEECQKCETELLNQNPSDHVSVLAKHNRAQAFRMFFERVQTTVKNSLHQEIEVSDVLTVETYKDILNGNAQARW